MKSIRVLIVDDIPQVRQGLATMLRLATKNLTPNIEVIGEAQNGCEAIQLSQILHPDAILMDLEMPAMDGFMATQTIKSKDPSTFIIILTIYDDPYSRQKAFQAGADTFIDKSAPIEGLIRVIQSVKKVI
jgi:DNA-binding NarL/FixJ family response regulator